MKSSKGCKTCTAREKFGSVPCYLLLDLRGGREATQSPSRTSRYVRHKFPTHALTRCLANSIVLRRLARRDPEMHVDLLLDMVAKEAPTGLPRRAPALETLVARGDHSPCAASSFPECLLECFDVPTQDAPVAAITLLGDGKDPGLHYWLRADPVSLQATRTRLMLAPLAEDELSTEEARTLAAALTPHLAATGHELLVCHPQRWYIRCPSSQRLHTEPPLAAAGLLTEDRMPSGEDGPSWRRLMTEAQMLLHEHPVNEARAASGKLAVTGIWPWGGGILPTVAPSRYTDVYSDDPLARGLARASGATVHDSPRDTKNVLERSGRQSIVLVADATMASGSDMTRFDAAWMSPLKEAITHGALSGLRLLLVCETGVVSRTVQRSHLRRFWRRARPLSGHA